MPDQQYTWLLALSIVAWQQPPERDHPENPAPALQDIYARAGTIQNAPARSSNDPAAMQFDRAKYRANLLILAFFLCKLNAARFFHPNRPKSPYPLASGRFRPIPNQTPPSANSPASSHWR